MGVFCEPCGDSHRRPLYARELNKGINGRCSHSRSTCG